MRTNDEGLGIGFLALVLCAIVVVLLLGAVMAVGQP